MIQDPFFFKRCLRRRRLGSWGLAHNFLTFVQPGAPLNFSLGHCVSPFKILNIYLLYSSRCLSIEVEFISGNQNLTAWQHTSRGSSNALTVTSDLTPVWRDLNGGVLLKPWRWSSIPSAELSEGSASFCIPRQDSYLANNLHLDRVPLMTLSGESHTFCHSPGAARTYLNVLSGA